MKTGLYIHIPYCRKKCGYCGFVSYPLSCSSVPDTYVGSLLQEMRLYRDRSGRIPVDTVFIGGGTPSLLTADQIDALFSGIREYFDLDKDAEITCEANPDSLTGPVLQAMRQAGVNRLSIGIQSMNDRLLGLLGRIHNADRAVSACHEAAQAGFENINIDLMFGIPEQTEAEWLDTLDQILRLRPAHLSLYTVQLEEGTPFYNAYKEGSLSLPDTETDRRMYHDAVRILRDNGWHHYEISNFAMPGKECRHNEKYWDMSPFIGLGPSAASYYDGRRYKNDASIDSWEDSLEKGRIAFDGTERESEEDAIEIFCFTALRTAKGLVKERFLKRFGMTLKEAYRSDPLPTDEWARDGLVRDTGDCLILTEKGIDVSNEIMSAFMR